MPVGDSMSTVRCVSRPRHRGHVGDRVRSGATRVDGSTLRGRHRVVRRHRWWLRRRWSRWSVSPGSTASVTTGERRRGEHRLARRRCRPCPRSTMRRVEVVEVDVGVDPGRSRAVVVVVAGLVGGGGDAPGGVRSAGELVVDIGLATSRADVVRGDTAGDARDRGEGEGDRNHHARQPTRRRAVRLVSPLDSRPPGGPECSSRAARAAQVSAACHGADARSAVPWVRMAKVLIVEDDDRVRVPLVHSLTSRGHTSPRRRAGCPRSSRSSTIRPTSCSSTSGSPTSTAATC